MRIRPAVVPLIASMVAVLALLARVAVAQPDTACAGDPNLPGVARVNAELAAQLDAASAAHDAPASDGGASRPRYTNRLVLESSPYLLQHAHNPVNWYTWGDEAFERAKCERKPVLLSIGYSTCHWCHVMERESFENEEIARFLNEHFVAVKVDREERPDVDNVYMQAVQLLTGGGGWPMTLALTPERQPFFAATYIPPRDGDRGAEKGFLTVLGELASAYRNNPAGAVEVAAEISRRIAAQVRNRPAASVPDAEAITRAVASLTRAFDPTHGGFGIAPKFPQPSLHELLLHFFRRTSDTQALAMVTRSLEQMAAGGIHDHLGGGFHRYSTDAGWQVPHFEKMLYDNAQLASLYLDAYQVTGRPDFAQVARGTLDYLAREMTAPEGGFYGASDADSRTPADTIEEGWYYTWTPAETEEVLGTETARVANTYFGITDAGNFHARSILHTPASVDELATSLGIDPGQVRVQIENARRQLYAARLRRAPPFRDDKIVASWNGLAISAFARGGFVLDHPDDTRRASAAADFVLARMRAADGTLLHSSRGGRAHGTATLDDYAFVVQGVLDLFETTWQMRWLRSALDLQSTLDARYFDEEEGAYFLTPHTGEVLLARPKPSMDGAEPAGNSVAAMNLLRISELTSDEAPRRRAEALFRAFGATLRAGSPALPRMLCALDFYLDEPPEIVIVRAPGDTETLALLLARARTVYLPNRAFTVTDASDAPQEQHALVPLTTGKRAISGRTTAYVCRKRVCERPTSEADRFARQLRAVEPLLAGGGQPEAPHSNTNKHEHVSH